MNIVFASDQGYIPHLVTAICSLIRSNYDEVLDIYIINTDIDGLAWDKIVSLSESPKHKFIDVKISDKDVENLVVNDHFTKANYYRLFIPEKINSSRALYLDSDIVVVQSIKELYEVDINNFYLAAVDDVGFERHDELEMSHDAKYFNSGMMLLNLDAWRNDSVKDRVIEFVKRKADYILYVDQCGINAIVNGLWKEVHPRYNLHYEFFNTSDHINAVYEKGAAKEAMDSPVIVHYTGPSKPWNYLNDHPCRSLYWKYRRMTPFKRYIADDITFYKVLQRFTPISVKHFVKKKLKY